MTERPRATHSLTPRCDSSSPRPSTCLVSCSNSSNEPSPEPTSSTRDCGGMRLATTSRSTRWLPLTLMMLPPGRMILIRKICNFPGSCAQSSRPCRRADEAVDGCEQFRLVEQEGIVAAVGLDLDKGYGCAGRIECVHNRAALFG